jgi:proteic killer suppression protein
MYTSVVYTQAVIVSFADKATEELFNTGTALRFPADIVASSLRKLNTLDAATSLFDLAQVPSLRLEKLQGNRQGQYSIRINNQWRICFTWDTPNAYNVEIVDYH